jgi:uncharacterized membrane protein YheB (UPF0754 family)
LKNIEKYAKISRKIFFVGGIMLDLIIMIIVGSLIGWVTNYLAIKLLFKPYKPINILGFKIQGVIPKRINDIADNIAHTIDSELLSIKDITETINSMELESEIDKIVDEIVEEKLKKELLAKFPMLGMFLNDDLMRKIKGYIKDAIEDNKGEIVEIIVKKLESEVDFKELISKKIKEFSLEDIEKLTINIAKNELRHIEYIGALLGGVIGVAQFFITQLL